MSFFKFFFAYSTALSYDLESTLLSQNTVEETINIRLKQKEERMLALIESSPIPLFEIHGSQDDVTPLSGDPDNNDGWGSYPSISSTINYFAEKNQTTSSETLTLPNIVPSDGSFVVSEKYLNGTNNIPKHSPSCFPKCLW